MKQIIKSNLIYVLGLMLVAGLFFAPSLSGKKLNSHDTVSNTAAAKEAMDYINKGEPVYWTTHIFSGMPLYTLAAETSSNFLGTVVMKYYNELPALAYPLFLSMLAIFLSLLLLGINSRVAFIFSAAYGLNSWIMDSLGAGHTTKIMAISFVTLVFSGLIYTMKSKKYWGYLFIGIGLSLSIYINHVQETYYGAMMCIIAGVYFFIQYIKEGKLLEFFKKIALVLFMVLLAVLSNISALYNLHDYSKETMRGGKTELKSKDAGGNSTSATGGLDINYAYSWSYTPSELMNFIAPDAMGGSSNYKIKASKTELAKNSAEEYITLPFYWGEQNFTGGPNYMGVIVLFLFLFYIVYSENKVKWLLLIISIMSIFMGLGKHFLLVNEFLFNYLPFYNKFRTPTMSFSIINVISIIGAALFIQELLIENLDKEKLFKKLKTTLIIFGVIIIIGTLSVLNAGFTGSNDAQILQQNPNFPMDLLKVDRESFFKSDLIRAIFLILVAAGLIYARIKDLLKKDIILIVLGLFIIGDLWMVSKRYISNDIFVEASNPEDLVPIESYNQFLDQDKSHFRVFNTTVSTFNDNMDGFKYSNIGGYSPAKLYRYQDLIDRQLSKGSMPALNMLNMKYFIVENNGQKTPQQNPDAAGNSWFVNEVKWAKDADQEIDSLSTFNPKTTVWIDQRYKNETNFSPATDLNSTITLSKYNPDNMEYTSSSTSGGFVVFSEIWYRGNEEWKIYINGKESKMVRVNYLLRGAYIPAGNHKVEMKFKPTTLLKLLNVSFIFTIILLLFSLFIVWFSIKKSKTEIE